MDSEETSEAWAPGADFRVEMASADILEVLPACAFQILPQTCPQHLTPPSNPAPNVLSIPHWPCRYAFL